MFKGFDASVPATSSVRPGTNPDGATDPQAHAQSAQNKEMDENLARLIALGQRLERLEPNLEDPNMSAKFKEICASLSAFASRLGSLGGADTAEAPSGMAKESLVSISVIPSIPYPHQSVSRHRVRHRPLRAHQRTLRMRGFVAHPSTHMIFFRNGPGLFSSISLASL